jgi:hypothetical protein
MLMRSNRGSLSILRAAAIRQIVEQPAERQARFVETAVQGPLRDTQILRDRHSRQSRLGVAQPDGTADLVQKSCGIALLGGRGRNLAAEPKRQQRGRAGRSAPAPAAAGPWRVRALAGRQMR